MTGEVVSAEICLFQNSRIWTSQSGLTQFGHPDHSASSNSAERGPSGMEGAFESRRICVLTYIVCLGETRRANQLPVPYMMVTWYHVHLKPCHFLTLAASSSTEQGYHLMS